MSKQKHPTLKTLRQGQTIYHVVYDSLLGTNSHVVKYFLHSHNTHIPEGVRLIKRMPVSLVKSFVTNNGDRLLKSFYYSRRIAERIARR